MAIKEKTIKVRCCDFCGAAEEIEKEPIRTCSSCGKDFCIDCGEVFSAEYGNVEVDRICRRPITLQRMPNTNIQE